MSLLARLCGSRRDSSLRTTRRAWRRVTWLSALPKVRCPRQAEQRLADIFPALSDLVCAALQEDPYGQVQQDLPMIVEGLARYALRLRKLPEGGSFKPGVTQSELPNVSLDTYLSCSHRAAAVQQAVVSVLLEYRTFLPDLSWPTDIARFLQEIVDWA